MHVALGIRGLEFLPSVFIWVPRQNALYTALARQLIARDVRIVLIAHNLADNLLQQLRASPPLTKPFTEQELLDRMVEAIDAGERR